MHGLNFYDSQARQYDPLLVRFTSIDPLAEKYYSTSPYVYCLNNPLKYIDPDGRNPFKLADWGKLIEDGFKAMSATISFGAQASLEIDLNKAKTGVDFNIASVDLAGVKAGDVFHPGKDWHKLEIKQGVSVDLPRLGVGVETVIKEDSKGNLSREKTVSATALAFQGEVTTTTEIKQNKDGTFSNGECTTDATVKVKDIGVKVSAIIGVEVKFDTEKLQKQLLIFLKWIKMRRFVFLGVGVIFVLYSIFLFLDKNSEEGFVFYLGADYVYW